MPFFRNSSGNPEKEPDDRSASPSANHEDSIVPLNGFLSFAWGSSTAESIRTSHFASALLLFGATNVSSLPVPYKVAGDTGSCDLLEIRVLQVLPARLR